MWPDVLSVVIGLALPPISSWAWLLMFTALRTRFTYVLGWFTGGTCGGAVAAIQHDWPSAIGYGTSALAAAALWWWHRKDRKPALEALGSKALALRESLVRRARESARPRPVLRPSLRGAS